MAAEGHRKRIGSPLALQVAGLLLGGLIVAQLVTLFLTLALPPAPEPEYRLGDIAQALNGADVHPRGGRPLVRQVRDTPPGAQGPGWLVSPQSLHELAKTLGRRDEDVRLLFYTPLPFAGAAAPRPPALPERRVKMAMLFQAGVLDLPQLPQTPPSGPPPGAQPPGGQRPDLPMPGRARPGVPLPADAAGRMPPPMPGRGEGRGPRQPGNVTGGMPSIDSLPPGAVVFEGRIPLGRPEPQAGSFEAQQPQAAGTTTIQQAPRAFDPAVQGAAQGSFAAPPPRMNVPTITFPAVPQVEQPRAAQPETLDAVVTAPPPAPRREAPPPAITPEPAPVATAAPQAVETPMPAAPAPVATLPEAESAVAGPGAPPQPSRGLFGLAPVPFVQGDFVAAMKLPDGRWAVVQPEPEPFPNSWQRRVLIWFALSFALVAPLGLIFARRLVKPLEGFADAAEQLGRDPRAPVMDLEGPAEIGRAAQAFNQMQLRLRRFVDDRTAMIGAISHDLRTPLTRMRFRLEEAPDHVRDGMLEEVAQMEEMITSVLHFIRDASEPSSRETMDMRSILASVVDGATLTGGAVELVPGPSAYVDIDALGMKRVLSNLVDNALKYGDAARVRLRTEGGEAVAEVVDEGPGLPDDELERVFQPFYRGPARAGDKGGMGLGLAASRSIARAHGGDVRLRRVAEGLIAEVRLPLASIPA